MKSPEIFSFHPGRQHNLEQACQLQKAFDGFRHATSIYFGSNTVKRWQGYAPKVGAQLIKRSGAVAAEKVDTYALPEIGYLLKRATKKKIAPTDYLTRNLKFQEWVLRTYKPPKVCIGYDTSSWHVFKAWKGKTKLLLDLSIAVPQYKLSLAKKYGFNEDFTKSQTSGDNHLYDIYEKELELADTILCGSDFVKASCMEVSVPEDKLVVLPYGADLEKFKKEEAFTVSKNKDIKIVFIGSVNHRKGAGLLLQAWEKLVKKYKHISLHFFGAVQIPLSQKLPQVFFHGFVSQQTLISELQTAHISILPTFFEGSSLAIYQSMAMGLATITTPNAGSIIKDGEDGLLIEYGSVDEIYNSLELLIANQPLTEVLGAAAMNSVKEYTWDAYGNRLSNLIGELVTADGKKKPIPATVH